jgi:hypothetical protein
MIQAKCTYNGSIVGALTLVLVVCATIRMSGHDAHLSLPCAVDMEEEFRLLTLQVIGEAILSLPPEECDKVGSALHACMCNSRCRHFLAAVEGGDRDIVMCTTFL